MRPLVTAQPLPDGDIKLQCTICNDTKTIFTKTFHERERNKQMRQFNQDHATAHQGEPAIKDRVVSVGDLTNNWDDNDDDESEEED